MCLKRGTHIMAEEAVMARNVCIVLKSGDDRSWQEKSEEAMTMMTQAVRVGTPLPDLTLPRLDGGTLGFGDLRGKKVLLFMWGSW